MKTSRRSVVDPFIVMDVVRAAKEAEAAGRHIIHMEVGQPGTAAPATARHSLSKALDGDAMGYTVSLGLPDLRAGIAQLYQDWYGVTLDPSRVIVTSGSSGAFVLAFTALFDIGAKVGLARPGYPSYPQILKALSLEPVDLPTQLETGHCLKPADLKADLDGVIVASPANPTGTILSRQELGDLISACAEREMSFISDEIYHGLHYGERAISALEISDDVYVINSFSKYFSMTGWRIGWMIVPPGHVRTIERLAQHMFICTSHSAQVAALGALDGSAECEAHRAVYEENRRLMLEGLPKAGFRRLAPPDGAFYIYADVSDLTDDSRAFAAEILRDAGVAVTPGLDFDALRGHQTIRFSYACATPDIREGLVRLSDFMDRRTG